MPDKVNFEDLPIVDADEPPENEDWILSPEKRAKEIALFDMLPVTPEDTDQGEPGA